MIYNYTITTPLDEDNGLTRVLKDVSITPGEALKLYKRHHENLRGETIIKKRNSNTWQVIKLEELKKGSRGKNKSERQKGCLQNKYLKKRCKNGKCN